MCRFPSYQCTINLTFSLDIWVVFLLFGRFLFICSAYEYPIVSAPVIEETVLFSLIWFYIFMKTELSCMFGSFSSLSVLFPWLCLSLYTSTIPSWLLFRLNPEWDKIIFQLCTTFLKLFWVAILGLCIFIWILE